MMGLWEMARQIARTLTRRTGTPVLAGRIENPAYPCCLAEVSGETELGSRQIRRRVQVTLTCYPSPRRGREEGMQLLDKLERAAAEGCAAACAAHVTEDTDTQKNALACGSAHESASHLAEGETPWLRFIKKYPRYAAEPLPEGMNEAVRAGEDPTMAFLRLANQRLEHDLELLRREQVLKAACMGSAKSAAVPDEPDEFARGLLMG